MTTLAQKHEYKVTFNGSKTYFVMAGKTCVFATSTERKAMNYYNRMLKDANVK
jgi:hypothetical protein